MSAPPSSRASRARIDARPLTREAFQGFGDVVIAERADITPTMVNFGTAARRDHAAALENERAHAKPNLATFRCTPWSRFPVIAESMEKHPGSSQLFVPMKVDRYLVVVAPGDDAPDVLGLQAFLAEPGQGVVYGPGVWHMPLIVFGSPAEFVMFVWEDGTPLDCVVAKLREPVEIAVPER
ncbi:MAG: ureidoglycolate lyase [Labilithrix sp.]|nr:ureidoglycolate lyase [Labilithrix sp.]